MTTRKKPTKRPKLCYRTAGAVRGPDYVIGANGDTYHAYLRVKQHITGRIRGIYFTKSECHGIRYTVVMNEPEFQLTVEAIEVLGKRPYGEYCHFFMHLRDALDVCGHHRVFGGYGQRLIEALHK